jgi:hypothetical protein|tara:strand:+ start:340 stop:579 length:240 start_codon:yes stop_codon:yes gene_type:complete
MEDLQEKFEDELLTVIHVYNNKGISIHEQISMLTYLSFELCNKTFMDRRIGYTHMLTMLIQRIVFDMDDTQENNKKILH